MNTVINILNNIDELAYLLSSLVISDYDYEVIVYHDTYEGGKCISVSKSAAINSAYAFASLFIFDLFDTEEWISYVDSSCNGHRIIHKYIGKFDSSGFKANNVYFASKAGVKSIIVQKSSRIDEQSIRLSPEYRDEWAGYLRKLWIPGYFKLNNNEICYKKINVDQFQSIMNDFILSLSMIYDVIKEINPIMILEIDGGSNKKIYFLETSERFYLIDCSYHD